MVKYPNRFIRGIANRDCLRDQSGTLSVSNIGGAAFTFSPQPNHTDGKWELSVNWEDDNDAISFTLSQKKEGRIQFRVGVVILPRTAIDEINKSPSTPNWLSYERLSVNDNKYHGNLLVNSDLHRQNKRLLSGLLAWRVVEVVSNSNP